MFQTYNRCRLKMHDVHADMKKKTDTKTGIDVIKKWPKRERMFTNAALNNRQRRLKVQYGPFHNVKRAVRDSKTGRFRKRNDINHKTLRIRTIDKTVKRVKHYYK